MSRLGVIAGGGPLPRQLAATARAQGRGVFVLALEGHADGDLLAGFAPAWIRMGEAGRGFDLLREAGVDEVVMAGPVRRPSLAELLPDWRTARFFARIGWKALGDDGLLRAVISEFESEGFRVVGVESVLGGLMARTGLWGAHRPDEQGEADIRRGIEVARGIGRLDIGQAVVVQQGVVLAVEAIEGTDAMVARSAGLTRQGAGAVLVKIAKPGQERRVDLPTIGVVTVANCAAAGIRGIAVEAGATLVVERDAVVAAADEAGIFLLGVECQAHAADLSDRR